MKSLRHAMLDPALFGRTFGGPTFANWRAIDKVLDGLALTADELAFYRQVMQRDGEPAKACSDAYLIKGRAGPRQRHFWGLPR